MEMRILRKIENKIRNEEVRKRLGVPSVLQQIKDRQWSWYGHLIQLNSRNQVNEIWEASWNEKKRRGKLKQIWNQGYWLNRIVPGMRQEMGKNSTK